jgi:hypothetical protein
MDEVHQNVFGWAYVTHRPDGQVNIDQSGDFVDDVEELERAAYDFVMNSRRGDADHDEVQVAVLIESMVFTPEKLAALGVSTDFRLAGWWVGFHVFDPVVWDRVVSGELKMFSISGTWTETPIDASYVPRPLSRTD